VIKPDDAKLFHVLGEFSKNKKVNIALVKKKVLGIDIYHQCSSSTSHVTRINDSTHIS
jgi:hypothetical protein